jgi:glycosyltransferase involved in cell wall biosynthesis
MKAPRATNNLGALMLVSADVGESIPSGVRAGLRPCPEYLRLQDRHGVRLLDWSQLAGGPHRKSVGLSVRHAGAALAELPRTDVVLSDAEHVGIPLAVAMRARRFTTPHLVIGHHLGSPRKAKAFRWAKAGRRMDRVLVHSPNQVELWHRRLGLSLRQLQVIPYGVDTDYWAPGSGVQEADLVLSAGREHRDHQTLVDAVGGMGGTARLFVADGSTHSPGAPRRVPQAWPEWAERRGLSLLELREHYDRATVVVVPVLPTVYPFGITTLLEAMAMAKPVVVSDTEGLRGVVEHGRTGLIVPSGDPTALRRAVRELLEDAGARESMGRAAREAVLERFSLDQFVDELGRHLDELAGRTRVPEHRP